MRTLVFSILILMASHAKADIEISVSEKNGEIKYFEKSNQYLKMGKYKV